MKKFIHFNRYSDFQKKKVSASADNTTYRIGGEGSIYKGVPDIKYSQVVLIKDISAIYTHDKIYCCANNTSELYNIQYAATTAGEKAQQALNICQPLLGVIDNQNKKIDELETQLATLKRFVYDIHNPTPPRIGEPVFGIDNNRLPSDMIMLGIPVKFPDMKIPADGNVEVTISASLYGIPEGNAPMPIVSADEYDFEGGANVGDEQMGVDSPVCLSEAEIFTVNMEGVDVPTAYLFPEILEDGNHYAVVIDSVTMFCDDEIIAELPEDAYYHTEVYVGDEVPEPELHEYEVWANDECNTRPLGSPYVVYLQINRNLPLGADVNIGGANGIVISNNEITYLNKWKATYTSAISKGGGIRLYLDGVYYDNIVDEQFSFGYKAK